MLLANANNELIFPATTRFAVDLIVMYQTEKESV